MCRYVEIYQNVKTQKVNIENKNFICLYWDAPLFILVDAYGRFKESTDSIIRVNE
jgi:hypothetical protein